MKYHPYTEMWPLLKGKAFEELKADIKANNQQLPILTYQDMVLDGRNRERACTEAGVAPRYEAAPVSNDNEAINLVVSLNTNRRHLTPAQRAFAGEKLAKLQQGGARNFKSSKELLKLKVLTLKEAAVEVGSNNIAVRRARAIRKYGTEADVEDVVTGKVKLSKRAAELTEKAVASKPPKTPKPPKRAKRGRPRKNESQQPPRRTRYATPGDRPRLEDTMPTREQIDPEFKGDALEWKLKYGQNPVMTALQYATMYFGSWTSNVKELARIAKAMPDWPEVDHNWLRAPKPSDVAKLTGALDYLRPKIAEAEKLLARAVETTKQKAVA